LIIYAPEGGENARQKKQHYIGEREVMPCLPNSPLLPSFPEGQYILIKGSNSNRLFELPELL